MQFFKARDILQNARLGIAAQPAWARLPDSTLDVSDDWMTATDPQNERGELCTAHFDHAQVWVERESADPYADCAGWETRPVLKGIRIDGDTTTCLPREDVIARLGEAWVDAVEEQQRVQEAAE